MIYVMTHDSIGVGEDGPTHQPIEQLACMRATPNTYMWRPADSKETAAAYISALQASGPSVIALSRQTLPLYEETGEAALKGGYVLKNFGSDPSVILIRITSYNVCYTKLLRLPLRSRQMTSRLSL